MISKSVAGILCVLAFCVIVNAEDDSNVPRGTYPFMAFIYYSDETVVDSTNNRFVRGAVIIRNNWLLSSAIAPDDPDGFPRKTLLARAGAITIDANFTLNEDEYEQEREIIQIIRPYNQSATEWWRTDISLMKTLLPFNNTSAVSIYDTDLPHVSTEKTCLILVYVRRFGNWTEDKLLMKIDVEVLSPSMTNCGNHFIEGTMTCAIDIEEDKHATYGPDFCQGNSGGPLICESKVMGLQTYIGNNCKQPYLYQLLTAWENFITCGIEDKCQKEECAQMCDITNKDTPIIETKAPVELVKVTGSTTELVKTTETTTITTKNTILDTTITTEKVVKEDVSAPPTPTTLITTEEPIVLTTIATTSTTTEHHDMKLIETSSLMTTTSSDNQTISDKVEEDEESSWPKEKEDKKAKELESERAIGMESQLTELKEGDQEEEKLAAKHSSRSVANFKLLFLLLVSYVSFNIVGSL